MQCISFVSYIYCLCVNSGLLVCFMEVSVTAVPRQSSMHKCTVKITLRPTNNFSKPVCYNCMTEETLYTDIFLCVCFFFPLNVWTSASHRGMLVCNLSIQQGIGGKWRPLLRWREEGYVRGAGYIYDPHWVSLCVCICVCVCVRVVSQPSECEQCTCDNDGIARCLVADCAPPPCVNPVYQPGKCCPECQDGESKIAKEK